MKKMVLIFTVLISIMSLGSCGNQGERLTYVVANTPDMEAINTESELSEFSQMSELQAAQSITPVITTKVETNCDGGDKRILTDLSSDVYKDVSYEISASLNEVMPKYRFVAKGMTDDSQEWARGYAMGLEVYDENEILLLLADFSEAYLDQVIGNAVYNLMMDTMGLHVTDVNFDGYKDVIILNDFSGAHGNTWYNCWLWNPETSTFIVSASFADIANPALDSEKKYIYSTGGSGAGNQAWDIHQFIDGEFKVTNRVSYNETNEGYHFIEQKLINGEMEILREDVVNADSFGDALSAAGYINDDLWQLDNPRWYGVGGHQADQWLE